MPVVRGQKSNLGQTSIANSQSCTWSVNPTAGNTILVWLQVGTSTSANLTVKDNGTSVSTFVLDSSEQTGAEHSFIYRANNISLPSAGSYAVTVTTTGPADTIQIAGIEYSGLKPGAPAAVNQGTATSSSVSTGAASSTGVQFGGFSDNFTSTETITYTGTGTSQFLSNDGTNFWPCAVADNVGSGSMTHTWTLAGSRTWSAAIAAYDALGTSLNRPTLYGTVW